MAGIFNKNRVAFHDWLMGLTMALTPRTQTLIYTYETPDDSYSMDWFADTKTVMQALKTLALRGASGSDYYLFDVHPFLTAAPNLETFYALDCGGNMIASSIFPFLDVLDGEPWTRNLAVGKVRKMVLDEVHKAVFEKLMQRCAELEDLVYYLHFWYDCPDITRAFAQMERRLKKLCFGFLPPPLLTGYESLLEDVDYGNITPVTSLREFTQLEELVLDQALLSRQPDGSRHTTRDAAAAFHSKRVFHVCVQDHVCGSDASRVRGTGELPQASDRENRSRDSDTVGESTGDRAHEDGRRCIC